MLWLDIIQFGRVTSDVVRYERKGIKLDSAHSSCNAKKSNAKGENENLRN